MVGKWYHGKTRLGKTWKAINDMEFNITHDEEFVDLEGLYIKDG